jgi:putative ABC transport system ATP-binding protein
MPLIEARNLRKSYRLSRENTVDALRGVNVRIDEGEMVAIMGPSGSGKSTLMHLLGLLHQPDTDGGIAPELSFRGRDMAKAGDGVRTRVRATEMGFVFQAFNLVPVLTAAENVALAAEYAGTSGSRARRAANEALALVGLSQRAGHRPAQLSGGEQERVAIARALVNQPPLILADEPTGNLDSATSVEVMELLSELNREGLTIVMVTHNEENQRYFDRTVVLRDGVVQCELAECVVGAPA